MKKDAIVKSGTFMTYVCSYYTSLDEALEHKEMFYLEITRHKFFSVFLSEFPHPDEILHYLCVPLFTLVYCELRPIYQVFIDLRK